MSSNEEAAAVAARRAIAAAGGSRRIARAAKISPRLAQRIMAGSTDVSPELLARLGSAVRAPLWALDALAKRLGEDSPRASIARLRALLIIARLGVTSFRDVIDALDGDPNSTSGHQHIRRLIELGLVADLGEGERTGERGRGARKIALSEEGWRGLGFDDGASEGEDESEE